MKVVLAAPTWSLNGPVVFSANLARGLISRGIDTRIVLTRPDWRDEKPLPRPSGLSIMTLPLRRDAFLSARERWSAMIAYLEQLAPCVYIPNHDFWHSCIAPELSPKVAICGIIHSDDPEHYEHARRLGSYWNRIVAVSSHIGRELSKRFPPLADRTTVIPYGVAFDPEYVDRQPDTEVLRVIYAGRLDASQKRVLDLPEVVRHATRELGIPLKLTIAGSGPAEGQLRESIERNGVGEHIRFCNTLDQEALLAEFRRHDAFLLTSAFEGLSIAMLEAMGQGCIPVVTNTQSGVPDTIVDGVNGFVNSIGDITGIAERLRILRSDPVLAQRMSRSAYDTIRTGGYSVEAMTARYESLFQSMLKEPFFRPRNGRISRPPQMQWSEVLPGPLQMGGDWVKRRLGWKE